MLQQRKKVICNEQKQSVTAFHWVQMMLNVSTDQCLHRYQHLRIHGNRQFYNVLLHRIVYKTTIMSIWSIDSDGSKLHRLLIFLSNQNSSQPWKHNIGWMYFDQFWDTLLYHLFFTSVGKSSVCHMILRFDNILHKDLHVQVIN